MNHSFKIYAVLVLFLCFSKSFATSLYPGNVAFIENKGQLSIENSDLSNALFYAKTPGLDIYVMPDGISYIFTQYSYTNKTEESSVNSNSKGKLPDSYRSQRVDMKFINSSRPVSIEKFEEQKVLYHFYNDDDPNGITDVKAYKKIVLNDIYDGIDLALYSNEGKNSIKYDLIVKSGVDPEIIEMKYRGIKNIDLLQSGDLQINTTMGEIIEESPYVYQFSEKNGNYIQSKIDATFLLNSNNSGNHVKIHVGDYDKSETLIIDPNVLWSKLFGGSGADHAFDICIDEDDYFYLTGHTLSGNLPITNGAYQEIKSLKIDLYVAKFDPFAELIWATFYGSVEEDYCRSIAIDNNFDVYVAGHTFSIDFPVSTGAYQDKFNGGESDGFLIKFRNNGIRDWATFVGGDRNEQIDDIAIDSNQNPVIIGQTTSEDFPVDQINGFQKDKNRMEEAVIANFNSDGQFIWGTYFGGDSTDVGRAVEVDKNGDIIITGETLSTNIPIGGSVHQENNKGFLDIFIAKFNSNGSFKWSTYFGGERNDEPKDLELDSDGNIYLTGVTFSNIFPTTPNVLMRQRFGITDGIISKFTPQGVLVWSTLYGGASRDICHGLYIDSEFNVIFTGETYSDNIPLRENSFKDTITGINDGFVIKMSNDADSLIWGGYIGGSEEDVAYDAITDDSLNVIICGDTESPDFPIFNDPDEFEFVDFIEGFVTKICKSHLEPRISPGDNIFLCPGDSVMLDAGDDNYSTYVWNTGDSTRTILVKEAGEYFVKVIDGGNCFATSPSVFVDFYEQPTVEIFGNDYFCIGDSTKLFTNNEFEDYLWNTGAETRHIWVKEEGRYVVEITNINGCKAYDTIEVRSHSIPKPVILGPRNVCQFTGGHEYKTNQRMGHSYNWLVNGGVIIDGQGTSSIVVEWGGAGTGTIELAEIIDSVGCSAQVKPFNVRISEDLEPQITSVDSGKFYFCEGDSIVLDPGEYREISWNNGYDKRYLTVKEPGIYHVTVYDGTDCWGYDTVEVYMLPLPKPRIFGDEEFCIGAIDIEYSTAFDEYSSYLWNVTGGNIKSGQGTNRITIDWDTDGEKTLQVTQIVDSSECSGTSEIFTVRINPLPEPVILHDGDLRFCRGDSVRLYLSENYPIINWNSGATSQSIIARSNGNYFVNVTDENGCSSSANIDVIVDPLPEDPIISESGDTLSAPRGYEYQWFFDGEEISGADNYFYIADFTGSYSVMLTNEFGCTRLSDPFDAIRGDAFIRIIMPESKTISTNQNVKIPISIRNSSNLDRAEADMFELYIKYNSTVLLEQNAIPIERGDNYKIIKFTGFLSELEDSIMATADFRSAWGDTKCSFIELDSVAFPNSRELRIIADQGTSFCIDDLCESGDIVRLFVHGERFELTQNQPNPFSEYTEFDFVAIEKGRTILEIRDLKGNLLETLMDSYIEPGRYHIILDNIDLTSGVYFYTLRTPTSIETRKMQVLR